MRLLLSLLLLSLSLAAPAEVYRRVDAQGNVEFSDTPTEGAEVVQLKETTVIPGAPVPAAGGAVDAAAKPANEAYAPYQSIAVVAPANEETLRNQETVGVDVEISPELLNSLGHRVQLYLDGVAYGQPASSPHFTLTSVDRGTHQLSAAVLDPGGSELFRSATTVFHMHKTAVADPKTGRTGGIRPASPPAK